MDAKKPQNTDEYCAWLTTERNSGSQQQIHSYYESVAQKIKSEMESSAFWRDLTANLREYNDQYLIKTGFPLLMGEGNVKLLVKPFDSFFSKTLKKNVTRNKNWPDPPGGGWILPENWFSRINDIVRTLFVVKYLDGVLFMVEKLKAYCGNCKVQCLDYLEAREEGYYAAHVYARQTVEIPKITWDTETVQVSLELQITTQLQETIRRLLHNYYERRRRQPIVGDVKWQWDFKNDEFAANYLGHILHYVEGMIMDIREKQK